MYSLEGQYKIYPMSISAEIINVGRRGRGGRVQSAEQFSDMLDKINTEAHIIIIIYIYIHTIRELKGGYTILV